MCDFHEFGLTLFFSIMCFCTFENVKNVFWVVARLPQRLKSTFFKFFRMERPEGASGVKKFFQKTLILAIEVIVQPPKTHF